MARTQREPGRLGADRGAKPSEAEGFLALDDYMKICLFSVFCKLFVTQKYGYMKRNRSLVVRSAAVSLGVLFY